MLLFPLYDIVGQSYFGVMTYNCENAFDTIHDEGCDDLEYTPNGLNSWKRDKFYNKIRNTLCKIKSWYPKPRRKSFFHIN